MKHIFFSAKIFICYIVPNSILTHTLNATSTYKLLFHIYFILIGVSITLHGLANMGVNKTANQQFLTSLVDLLRNNLNILSKMDDQGIANTIHSYVYK